MRILHYTLGFPPMRSGGLTRYAVDLMQAQQDMGHDICALYPGNSSWLSRKMLVVKEGFYGDIACFKIKNALFVPLLYGIKNPEKFVEKKSCVENFKMFFVQNHFDILHLHTLMGMPKSFLLAAKECGVKIVYTSHDYFGLCPKVNFINSKGEVCCGADEFCCAECNATAKPSWYIWLRNSKLLLIAKKLLKR